MQIDLTDEERQIIRDTLSQVVVIDRAYNHVLDKEDVRKIDALIEKIKGVNIK